MGKRARVVVGIREKKSGASGEKAASLRGLPQTVFFSSGVSVRLLACLVSSLFFGVVGLCATWPWICFVRGVIGSALNCCLFRTCVEIQFENYD